jgi:hypothetical protein
MKLGRTLRGLGAGLAVLAAVSTGACSRDNGTSAEGPSSPSPGTDVATPSADQAAGRSHPLLAIMWEDDVATLLRVDPRSLRPFGSAAVPLGRHTSSPSFSPDGSQLALGTAEDPARLRLIDLKRMRIHGDATLGRGSVEGTAWLSPTRLIAPVETPDRGLVLVVVDAAERRVLARREIDGRVQDSGRLGDRLILLLSPRETIGPARLVVVDADGQTRGVALDRINAGSDLDEQGDLAVGRGRGPGLAIDPEGARAYVVGAGEPVAEVDLEQMEVSYHSLAEPVSLLERFRNWLEPTAQAKGVSGPFRQAHWLRGGLLAVSGYNDETYIDSSGEWHYEGTPAGLKLIDTRDWSVRTIDEAVNSLWLVAGALVALDEDGAVRGYTIEGRPIFNLRGQQPIGVILTARRYAYVLRMDNTTAVIDVRSGKIVGRTKSAVQSILEADAVGL